MKITLLLFLATCALLFQFTALSFADAPDLEAGVEVQDGGGPIDVDSYLVPACADWNEDGAKDLLVGQYNNGYINLFLNQTSDFMPVFVSSFLLESSGIPITTSFG